MSKKGISLESFLTRKNKREILRIFLPLATVLVLT